MTDRRAELSDGLARTRERIEAACVAAGRSPDEITLIVVTKYFPMTDVAHLVDLGVTDIGENRDQEAKVKVAELREQLGDRTPTIHFIGQAQRNKANSIARYADVVHSVDRAALAVALDRGASHTDRVLDVLIQVDLGEGSQAGRGGAVPTEVLPLADQIRDLPHLRLAGVMAVAPLGEDPDQAFARLARVADEVRSAYPQALSISAGMSGDLEAAVAHGATHLRVGTAILGSRPPHL